MHAILIHFLGYVVIDRLLPIWAVEVESGFACVWYASFALIDVIAMCATSNPYIKFPIAVSAAWSSTLAIETILLQDLLQSHDYIAQFLIDGSLIIMATVTAYNWACSRLAQRSQTE